MNCKTEIKETSPKRGRPSVYKKDFVRMAFVACSEGGATDVVLARLFGVALSTLNEWKGEHSEFSESIKRGKDYYDTEVVEKNLLKRANGYRYTEVTKESGKNGEMRVTKRVQKESLPDVTAQIFWLKNRHSDRWRDTKQLGGSMTLHLTHEQALELLK